MHSSSPPSHSPHYPSHFGQTNACRPVSPERCLSAGCSDSLEDPHRCSPPCCRSERRRTERWREREREREWKRERERETGKDREWEREINVILDLVGASYFAQILFHFVPKQTQEKLFSNHPVVVFCRDGAELSKLHSNLELTGETTDSDFSFLKDCV